MYRAASPGPHPPSRAHGRESCALLRSKLPMPHIDPRDEQMFPKFGSAEIDRLRRFGEIRRYAAGEPLFATGDIAPGMFVLITGSVKVTRHDPLGRLAPIIELGPGEFVAEVGQLSGRPAPPGACRCSCYRRCGGAAHSAREPAGLDDRRTRAGRQDYA